MKDRIPTFRVFYEIKMKERVHIATNMTITATGVILSFSLQAFPVPFVIAIFQLKKTVNHPCAYPTFHALHLRRPPVISYWTARVYPASLLLGHQISSMDLPPTSHFDPSFTHNTHNDGDAEAALEALRVAIGQPVQEFTTPSAPSQIEPQSSLQAHVELTNDTQQTIEKALGALSQLSGTSQTILENMNIPGIIQGLTGSLRLLVESNKSQTEVVRGLLAQLSGQGEYFPSDLRNLNMANVLFLTSFGS